MWKIMEHIEGMGDRRPVGRMRSGLCQRGPALGYSIGSGLSRTQIYRLMGEGCFLRNIKLTERSVAGANLRSKRG